MANGHGGRRANSGRKPGAVTVRTRAVGKDVLADGQLSPLEFLLSIVRNENEPAQRRLEAAKHAVDKTIIRMHGADHKVPAPN